MEKERVRREQEKAQAARRTKEEEMEKARITQEAERRLRSNKARVEFRDAHGNVLDQDVVFSLQKEGKIHVETRFADSPLSERGRPVDVVDGKIVNPFGNAEDVNAKG